MMPDIELEIAMGYFKNLDIERQESEMVTYAAEPGGTTRFRQFKCDPLPVWAVDVRDEEADPICKYPMVEARVYDMRAVGGVSTDLALQEMKVRFDELGPYEYARRHGLLVNNSAEEFACQFMAFWNEYTDTRTY